MHYQSRSEPVPSKAAVWNFPRSCWSWNLCIICYFPLNATYFLQDLLRMQWYIIYSKLISQVRANTKEFRWYFQTSLCFYSAVSTLCSQHKVKQHRKIQMWNLIDNKSPNHTIFFTKSPISFEFIFMIFYT